MKQYLLKLRDFLKKDTGEANESTKLRYVVRLMLCYTILYNLIATIGNSLLFGDDGIVSFVVFFLVFVLIFVSSYFLKKIVFVTVFNISILCWVLTSILMFGWSAGTQMMLVVLLVLDFFSSYKNNTIKVCYAVFLVCFRIVMFDTARHTDALHPLTYNAETFAQILNSVFAFVAIGTLCFIFSRDSQELEGKLVEYNIKLVNQANTDPLTGLNNRRKTMEFLESLMSDARTTGICVSICDIDFFKKVNDTYGHDIGDKVLKSIAQTMVSTMGDSCFISRWGGEEFLIVFSNMNGDDAYVLLQNLRTEISKLKFEVKDRSFKISLTYGLAEYDYHSDALAFIKEADNKLYIGKENGRDQVVF